jgi:ABC-type anion transport system duplicated permease subunit
MRNFYILGVIFSFGFSQPRHFINGVVNEPFVRPLMFFSIFIFLVYELWGGG